MIDERSNEEILLTAIREKNYDNVGVMLAALLNQDAKPILDVIQAMLEDINAHSLNRMVDTWREFKGV